MKKLSITSENLSSFNLEVSGSTIDILFLYMQMCKQLINNKLATPQILKGIVNLTNYDATDTLKVHLFKVNGDEVIIELAKEK